MSVLKCHLHAYGKMQTNCRHRWNKWMKSITNASKWEVLVTKKNIIFIFLYCLIISLYFPFFFFNKTKSIDNSQLTDCQEFRGVLFFQPYCNSFKQWWKKTRTHTLGKRTCESGSLFFNRGIHFSFYRTIIFECIFIKWMAWSWYAFGTSPHPAHTQSGMQTERIWLDTFCTQTILYIFSTIEMQLLMELLILIGICHDFHTFRLATATTSYVCVHFIWNTII